MQTKIRAERIEKGKEKSNVVKCESMILFQLQIEGIAFKPIDECQRQPPYSLFFFIHSMFASSK